MPKFHFDLVDHIVVADQDGHDFEDVADAMDYGERLAAHLRIINPAYIGNNYYVLITDENGEEVHRSLLDLIRPSLAS